MPWLPGEDSRDKPLFVFEHIPELTECLFLDLPDTFSCSTEQKKWRDDAGF